MLNSKTKTQKPCISLLECSKIPPLHLNSLQEYTVSRGRKLDSRPQIQAHFSRAKIRSLSFYFLGLMQKFIRSVLILSFPEDLDQTVEIFQEQQVCSIIQKAANLIVSAGP
ncbi:relaxin-3 [Platysternon megacephalum]|uniref:Relaxin-3 n=1 Tax=Platysternon megacephalum TaxID=55544 RepID=A0A4D9E3D1_9SAUR|nr:relaxin-3 [Platysternon megacephalum]